MTSNIGAEYLMMGASTDGDIDPETRDKVMAELRAHFRPEFLNRVDDIILFRRLTLPQIEKIVDLQVEELRHRLAERGTKLELNEDARRLIAEHGYKLECRSSWGHFNRRSLFLWAEVLERFCATNWRPGFRRAIRPNFPGARSL